MTEPVYLDLYADLHCPYAYLTAYRLRKLRDEYRKRNIVIEHRSLALEFVNERSTPRTILSEETPVLMLEEPDIPYQPWSRPDSEWPVTMWPAFEAVKCAARQSAALADELDWLLRYAFFAESKCISMRHVVLELAEAAGVDMRQFIADFDGGVTRRDVVDDARRGWHELKVEGSPTFVLPSGEQYSYYALPKAKLDPKRNYRLTRVEPAPCAGDDCTALYLKLFDAALVNNA